MNRKDIFMSGFKSKLTYPFNYKDLSEFETIVNFYEDQIKKYKEVINKANKWVRDYMDEWDIYDEVYHDLNDLLILLEEVEHEKN